MKIDPPSRHTCNQYVEAGAGAAELDPPAFQLPSGAAGPTAASRRTEWSDRGRILMYHNVGPKEATDPDQLLISASQLTEQLDYLRKNGYSLLTFGEHVSGDYPNLMGRKPVVLTFDDGRENNFRYLSDGSIDPTCAVGVFERYRKENLEWRVTATFFVNTVRSSDPDLSVFEQPGLEMKKIHFLCDSGYEIGSHGSRHHKFGDMDKQQIRENLDDFHAKIDPWLPEGYKIRSFAYPHGSIPSDRALQRIVERYYPLTANTWANPRFKVEGSGGANVPRVEMDSFHLENLERKCPPGAAQ